MGKIGRPKKKAVELIQSKARRGRIVARLAEEAPPVPVAAPVQPPAPVVDAEAVTAYVASVHLEWATFQKRRVPGEVLSRQHGIPYACPDMCPGYLEHGPIFGWHHRCFLTDCRNFAREVVNDPNSGPWSLELSTRFLNDLATTSHNCVFDVEAAKNVERMIDVWSDPNKPPIPLLRTLAMMKFISWKKPTGENRFPDELLLSFYPDDIVLMDKAFAAQQAAQI